MLTDTAHDSNESVKDSLSNEKLSNDKSSSYCTSCREELHNLNSAQVDDITRFSSEPNNFDNIFLPNIENIIEQEAVQSVSAATRSLSRVSLELENHQEEIINNKCRSNINLEQTLIFNTNNEESGEILIEYLEDDIELNSIQSQKNTVKQFCDKQIQTDPQYNEDNDPWDPEFQTAETDLQKIDTTVEDIAVTDPQHMKNKIKSNIQDNLTHDKKLKKITKPNYNSISSILLNRQKRLTHLSNDIYQFSSYLDGIKKALLAKEPPSVIPLPPAMTGYDNQFDFPNENRFEKLPIIIESSKTTKKPMSELVNSNSSESSRFGSGSSKLFSKRMNNGENEFVSKRFMHRITNKETLHSGKENGNIKKHKQSINDSTSMYAYNPLSSRLKRNSKFN